MAENQKILIIEDDKEIAGMLEEFLTRHNFSGKIALNGPEGLRLALTGDYDCILLDLMLPYMSGDEVLKELRAVSDVPVIVLSARSLIQNKIELLGLGADDYMTKPFDLNELLARIYANIKRSGKGSVLNQVTRGGGLHHGEVKLNQDTKSADIKGRRVELTAKEYLILELLMLNPTKVFSKQNLYESVWGEQYAYDNDTINTHISNIRRKLGSNIIKTVWGMGYILETL